MNIKKEFMQSALEEAQKAYAIEEVPVGAVIVKDGKILSRGHNKNRTDRDPVQHAEIIAIRAAAKKLGNERLENCDLYVTKEPCAMCAGAIVHARIQNVFIGIRDTKYGACGTVLSVCGNEKLNHIPRIEFGLMEDEASNLLKRFFRELRAEK